MNIFFKNWHWDTGNLENSMLYGTKDESNISYRAGVGGRIKNGTHQGKYFVCYSSDEYIKPTDYTIPLNIQYQE